MAGFFFFTFIEECCVVIENNIDKKLANRISYQIWYKGGGGGGGGRPSLRKGDPYLLADLNRGALNPLWQQDEVSSHLKYYQLSSEILD